MTSPIPTMALLLAALLLPARAGAGQVPGTGVSLSPPPGFKAAERFAGFVDAATGASIMINEIPGPFGEVTAAFRDPKLLGARGLELLDTESLAIGGEPALLVHAAQQVQGVRYRKWMLAVDHAGGTTLIAANYPADAADTVEEALRAALLGTELGAATDPADALRFTLAPPAPFALASVIGQTAVYTPEGGFPVQDESVPLLVAGLSVAAGPPVLERQAFAEQRITQVAGVKDPSVQGSTAVGIGGLLGVRTLATGEGAGGTPLTVLQIMLFDAEGYALIHGIGPSAERERLLPLFDAAAESFRLKR